MIEKIKAGIGAVVIGCVVLAVEPVAAKESKPPHLAIRIESAKTELVLYEPLVIRTYVSNTSREDFLAVPDHLADDLPLFVRPVDSKKRLVGTDSIGPKIWVDDKEWTLLLDRGFPAIAPPPPMPPIQQAPGTTNTAIARRYLFAGDGTVLFVPSRQYAVRAVFRYPRLGIDAVSNEVAIRILEPPEKEKDAYSRLASDQWLRFGLLPRFVPSEITDFDDRLHRFIAEFPDSVYTPYLQATCVERNAWRRTPREEPKPDDPRIAKYRKNVLKKAPFLLNGEETKKQTTPTREPRDRPATRPTVESSQSEDPLIARFGITTGEPIDSGFVFIDGRYLDSPYIVSRRGANVYINDDCVFRTYGEDKPVAVVPLEEVTLPEGIDKNSSLYDPRLQEYFRIKRAALLATNPTRDEEIREMEADIKRLPCIREARRDTEGSGLLHVTSYRGEKVTFNLAPPRRKRLTGDNDRFRAAEFKRANYDQRLRKGDCYFLFTRGGQIGFGHKKARSYLPIMVEILQSDDPVETKMDRLERIGLPSVRTGAFKKLVTHFSASPQLSRRIAQMVQPGPLVDVEEDSAPMMRVPAASTPAPIPVEQEALVTGLGSGDRSVRKSAVRRVEQLAKEELIRLAQIAVDDKERRESGAIYVSSRLLDIATEKGLGFKEAMALLDAPGSSKYFKVAILDWLYERRIADVAPPDLATFLAQSDQRLANRQEELDVRLAAHSLSRGLGSRILNELNESAKTGVKEPWHAKASRAIQAHVGHVCAIVADSSESDKAVECFAGYLPYYNRVHAKHGLVEASTLKSCLDTALENTKRSEKCRQRLQAARAKL